MKIALLSPIAWRTPPRQYGPWEQVASTIAEGLVAKGHDVSLFATGDSQTSGTLEAICPKPYGEDDTIDPKVWESLHIGNLMEKAENFDIIHNHYDFLPLTYSRLIDTPMVTTIHGFSSEQIIPVYKKYNPTSTYISISNADRHPDLDYHRTIYHGIDSTKFQLNNHKENYLLFYGRIHPDKGTLEAIGIAKKTGYPLKIAGLVQDQEYYSSAIEPRIDGENVIYLGNVGPTEGNELLGNAKALLHPILFDEPFGLSVAEAMMCGTPVIAFNRGSMPELIEDGNTGFLVDTVSEAVEVVQRLNELDPNYCRAYAMEKFSIDNMVAEYIEVYKDVIA
ncbi:glycosyltransferase family 4 protein [Pricia sp.]|uniref:glycosyltransferase family 4 protein n=1 Tax=Pricia sp. TaxID=2268138 RepID=UPI003593E3B5